MEEQEQSFEYAVSATAEQAAAYLESIAKYLRTGKVSFTAGAESIELPVGSDLKMEISAEHKPEKAKGSLQIEVSWKMPVVKEGAEIMIAGGSEGEPAAAAAPSKGSSSKKTPASDGEEK